MAYDEAGDTNFTINDSNISGSPPFVSTNCIAYNGTYWIAVGNEVVKTKTIVTYSNTNSLELLAYRSDDYLNEAKSNKFYWQNDLLNNPGNQTSINGLTNATNDVTKYTIEKQAYTTQSVATFNKNKELYYTTSSFTRKFVNTIAISTNGFNWTLIEDNPFSVSKLFNQSYDEVTAKANSVAWNGSKWLVVGKGKKGYYPNGTERTLYIKNYAAYSSDGINWNHCGSTFDSELYCVACSSSKWIVGGNKLYSSSDLNTWTEIATNFNEEYSKFYGSAYNGSTWVAVGTRMNGASIITSSNNGSTWNQRLGYFIDNYDYTFRGVTWNGNSWIAVGEKQYNNTKSGIIAKSEDGIDWTIQTGFEQGLTSISWDGNEWIIGGIYSNLYISSDGVNWSQPRDNTSNVNTVCTKIVLPILGGTINTVSSLFAGFGTPASIMRSYGTKWLPQLLNGEGKNYIFTEQKEFYSGIWNGTYWIIVGEPQGNAGRNIAISENGIDWLYPYNQFGSGKAVATNGTLIIAVGDGVIPNMRISKSSNALVWTSVSASLKSCKCIAWNGTYWVIGGIGGIITSTDGNTWTPSIVCPLTNVYGVAWNGYYWVAVGSGNDHCIALSTDSQRWYIADPTTIPFKESGSAIAWNRTKWVAVGKGGNTISTSDDGYTWDNRGNTIIKYSGTSVAWEGSKWIVSGYSDYPIVSSPDAETWTAYEVDLVRGNCFVNKTISLPYTGTASSTVLQKVNAILSKLTNNTNDTLAYEQEQLKLIQDEIAAAAALATRNASKSTATGYLNTVSNWKTIINSQFTPLTVKTYGDLSKLYPDLYLIATGFNEYNNTVIGIVTSLKNRVYDDTNSQDILNDTNALILSYVNKVESGFVTYYDTIRQLYSNLTTLAFDSVTSVNITTIINNYGFSTQRKNDVLNFYTAKLNSFTSLKNTAVTNYSTEITSININSFPDFKQYYTNLITYNTETLFDTGYSTNGSNSIYFLTLLNNLYPKINVYKVQAEAYIQKAKDDAINWANVLETTPPTEQSIEDEFNVLFVELYNPASLNPSFIPAANGQKLALLLTDFPVRKYKTLAETYNHPYSYPSAIQTLYTELTTAIDGITTTSNDAINYTKTKLETTLKNKLADIKNVTKTAYTLPLTTTEHLNTLLGKLYYSNSDYKDCVKYSKLLKSGYILYPELKQKILDVHTADINAEADGATPPLTGWGGVTNLQGNISSTTFLDNFRVKIFTSSSNLFKLNISYGIYFYKQVNQSIVTYRNNKRYLIDEIGDGYFVINGLENILNDITPTEYTWNFQLLGKDRGTPGLTQEWAVVNETVYARERLQSYIYSNGEKYGNGEWYTSKPPYITGITRDPVPWKEFLSFTNNVTYTEIKDKIDNLNSKIAEIENYDGFSESYIDSLVSTDLNSIQSKYVQYAESYIDSLTVGVSTLLPDNDIHDQFGDKIVTGSLTLNNIVDQLNTDYDYLVNELANTNLTGQTNEQIAANVNSAIATKNGLTSITYGTSYKTFLENARTYITQYQTTYDYINSVKNDVDRWVDNIKPKVLLNSPFDIAPISDGSGNPFIMSIKPDDTDYWQQVTRNEFKIIDTDIVTRTLPSALVPTEYNLYSSTTGYIVGDNVRRNDKVFRCIKDNSPDPATSAEGIRGVSPLVSSSWKLRKYPYVLNTTTYQIEGSPENLTKIDSNMFLKYDSDIKYIKGEYVSSNGNVYRCNNIVSSTLPLKQIVPTNENYWKSVSYPTVVYKGKNIEATPENLPVLNIATISEYASDQLYRAGNLVKYTGSFLDVKTNTNYTGSTILELDIDEHGTTIVGIPPWYRYNFIQVNNSDIWERLTQYVYGAEYSDETTYKLGDIANISGVSYKVISTYSRGTASSLQIKTGCIAFDPVISLNGATILQQTNWKVRTHPTVVYNFQRIEAKPGVIPAYTTNNVTAYSDNTEYNNGDIVSYQNAIYKCNVKYPGSAYKIPVENTNYWQQVNYPIITYLGKEIEAIPGIIPPLSTLEFNSYSEKTIYYLGDVVVYNSDIYECIGNVSTQVPIYNISPPSEVYWQELTYPLIILSKNNRILQADPASEDLQLLDEKDFHIYDNNWLYNKYDQVSYNGNVYECINCTPPSRQDGATPNTVTITNISPTNTLYWDVVEIDYTPLNITDWIPKVNYNINSKILYNGYFYNCETTHKSTNDNVPETSSYYWRKITDLTEIGLPDYYDSSVTYAENDQATLRVLKQTDYIGINYVVQHYTCVRTDPNEPLLYTYDKCIILGTNDSNGNPVIVKDPGTWNVNNLRRYGLSSDDPFRIEGFCGSFRRRVIMEVEMPYNNARAIVDINPNTVLFQNRFPNLYYAQLTPTNHTTRITNLQNILINTYNKLQDSEYEISINNLFDGVNDILIYQANKRNELVTDLNNSINILKMQYFYNPSTQYNINNNPYNYMNPISLAQDPPAKLFKDLGVGNLEEIEYDVFIGKTGKYTQSDYDFCKENTDKLDDILTQISNLTFEMKLMIGYGLYYVAIVSKSKSGIVFYTDSGKIFLPIGGYNSFENFRDSKSSLVNDTLLHGVEQIINNSAKPPEYTLPNSQATADLQIQTFEVQSPFMKDFLQPFAKAMTGIGASLFTGNADIIGGILSLVGIISLHASNAINDENENTSALLKTTQMPGIKFNTYDASIINLLEAAGNYKNAITQEEDDTGLSELLRLLALCLTSRSDCFDDIKVISQLEIEERSYKFSLELTDKTVVNVPDKPIKPVRPSKKTPTYKGPNSDLLKSLKAEKANLDILINDIQGKISNKLNLEAELPGNTFKSSVDLYREQVIVKSNIEITPAKPAVVVTQFVPGTINDGFAGLRDLKSQLAIENARGTKDLDKIRSLNKRIASLQSELGDMSLDPQKNRGRFLSTTIAEAVESEIKQVRKVKTNFVSRVAESQVTRMKNSAERIKNEEIKVRNDFKIKQRIENNSKLTDSIEKSKLLDAQISAAELEKLNAELELDVEVKNANKAYHQALEKYNQDLQDFKDANAKREVMLKTKKKLELQNKRTRINNTAKINEMNSLISIENADINVIESKVISGKQVVTVKYDILVERISTSYPFKFRIWNMLPDSIKAVYTTIDDALSAILNKANMAVTSAVRAWRSYAYQLSGVQITKFSVKWFVLEGGIFKIFKRPGLAIITGLTEAIARGANKSLKTLGGGSAMAGIGKVLELGAAILGAYSAGAFEPTMRLGV